MFFLRIIVTWVSCLLIVELLSSVDSRKLISILTLSLVVIVLSIFDIGLDLLALTTLVAFLVTLLFILIILVNVEGSNKLMVNSIKKSISTFSIFLFIFIILIVLTLSLNLSNGFSSWPFSFRWLDFYKVLSLDSSSIVAIIHYLSTRFFLLEFSLINIWIVFILLLSIFSLFYLWTNSKKNTSHIAAGSRIKRISRKKSSSRQI